MIFFHTINSHAAGRLCFVYRRRDTSTLKLLSNYVQETSKTIWAGVEYQSLNWFSTFRSSINLLFIGILLSLREFIQSMISKWSITTFTVFISFHLDCFLSLAHLNWWVGVSGLHSVCLFDWWGWAMWPIRWLVGLRGVLWVDKSSVEVI